MKEIYYMRSIRPSIYRIFKKVRSDASHALISALFLQFSIFMNKRIETALNRENANVESALGYLIDKVIHMDYQREMYFSLRRIVRPIGRINNGIQVHVNNQVAKFVLKQIVPSISEEIIFRFCIQRSINWVAESLGKKVGISERVVKRVANSAAIFASTYIFTIAHTGNVENPDSRQIFKSGVAFGTVYKMYGLLAAIFAHSMHNAIQSLY